MFSVSPCLLKKLLLMAVIIKCLAQSGWLVYATSQTINCSEKDTPEAAARCVIARYQDYENAYILQTLTRSTLKEKAELAVADINKLKLPSPLYLMKIRFLQALAWDPDNYPFGTTPVTSESDFGLALTHYRNVCNVYTDEQKIADEQAVLLCSAARFRAGMMTSSSDDEQAYQNELKTILVYIQHLSDGKSGSVINVSDPVIRRAIMLTLGTLAASKAESALHLASGYTELTLKFLASGDEQEIDLPGLSWALNIAELIVVSRPPDLPPTPDNIRLVHYIYERVTPFTHNSPAYRRATALLTELNIDIAKSDLFSQAQRTQAKAEANSLAEQLYQNILTMSTPSEQDEQLKGVEYFFEALSAKQRLRDVMLKRYVLSQQTRSPDTALSLLAELALQLSMLEEYHAQAENLARQLSDRIAVLPDTTPGIADAIYNTVETLFATSNAKTPCTLITQLLDLKAQSLRGQKIAHEHILTAGIAGSLFDVQLNNLNIESSRLIDEHHECSPAAKVVDPFEILKKQIREITTTVANSMDRDTLSNALNLFFILNGRIDETGEGVFINPAHDELIALARSFMSAMHKSIAGNPLRYTPTWTSFVEEESQFLYDSGQTEEAIEQLARHETDMANHKTELAPGIMTRVYALWPDVLRRDAFPQQEDQFVYRLLVRALIKQGQITSALPWLPMLDKYNLADANQKILEVLATRPVLPSEQAWLDTLSADDRTRFTNLTSEKRPPDVTIHEWIATDPASPARYYLVVNEYARKGKYNEAVNAAKVSGIQSVRNHTVDILLNYDAIEPAGELEQTNLSADSFMSLKASQARHTPQTAQASLSAGLTRLSEVKGSISGFYAASDLLCASSVVADKSFRVAYSMPFINMINSEKLIYRANTGRKLFSLCLIEAGQTAQGLDMLQAIVDPAIRLPALTAFMLKMSASDDAKLLSRAQSMAWTTFEALNAYRRSDYAAELFYASAHLNGHVQALTEVSKLIYAPNANDDDASRAQKSKNAATLTSRDYAIYEQALRGVLMVAAEKKAGAYVAQVLNEQRTVLGDKVVADVTIRLLNFLVKEKQGDNATVKPMLTLLQTLRQKHWQMEDVLDYVTLMAKFNLQAEAIELVHEMASNQNKAEALARYSHETDKPGACILADSALKYALQIPWRKNRIRELASLAAETAELKDCDVSPRAVQTIIMMMKGPDKAEQQVEHAYTRFMSQQPHSEPVQEAESQVRALYSFGRYYLNSGNTTRVDALLQRANVFDGISVLNEDLDELRIRLKNEPVLPARLTAQLDNWTKLAPFRPAEVLQDIASIPVFDYANHIDLGLKACELGMQLGERLSTGPVLTMTQVYTTMPALPPTVADNCLWLLDHKRRTESNHEIALTRQAVDTLLKAQSSASGAALLEAISRRQMAASSQEILRHTETAARRWHQLQNQIIDSLAASPDTDIAGPVRQATNLRQIVENNAGVFARRDERYRDMLNTQGKDALGLQRVLREDEALLLYRITRFDLYLGVITRRSITFYALDDAGLVTPEKIANLTERLLSPIQGGAPASFDYEAASDLYDSVLRPAEPALSRVKHLIIVPDKALLSIPFQILLRKPSPDDNDLLQRIRSAHWLVRDFSIEVLPSVAAFSFDSEPNETAPPSLIAFADPAFTTWQRPVCDGPYAIRVPGQQPQMQALIPTRLMKVPSVTIQPLPDTSCLVRTISDSFPVGKSQIFEGPQATEETVKQLSANGTLARYSIVMFATHGVMSGESIIQEPGIVLSTPGANAREDGYLSMSEILSLSLNAKLLVLSACNVAAGSGIKGAGEAMSGLTSAFLYAGARHIYITHWPLDSRAGSFLFSRIFEQSAKGERSGRFYAQALRRAELSMIEKADTAEKASPYLWGTISSVGQ
ncbi:hypothetical protein KR75_21105 [Klebsiella variicola]|uniref:CHAT domain-containing protein n=2 Tax=Klebsiella variicola TaxID=244366 RepID=UPI000578D67C|nr:CHAT domain-containing protein [Klebsiella variicola]AJA97265.1 hypothetical protein KR75_21105 [Klebsiella variicola]